MAVTYKKLWIMLIERNITKPEFRQMTDISPATLTKLNKNLHVNMEMLERICRTLHCTFDDVVEMLPESPESAE
ncbi:MAG: helix-turn-helix transcriptional regulator [Oscillospiraceae bacterium]|jgi:DNA-binding Xre family transcriptional regulator|nr:helix-turn-helix transcriptional regulator [Oscillospiraceae bacterium]